MKLKVTGFTDNVGTDEANQKLSERRSERVRDYLVERGISAARLSTFGRGENDPIDTNDTDAGRARNRRIEFTIVP